MGVKMAEQQLSGDQAQQVLEAVSDWGNVTTIILHAGSVFEFKGPFPKGSVAEGFYNLKGAGTGAAAGFEGHLGLSKVDHIAFQEKQHRGRDSYALVFNSASNECIFKIFLGRDENGEIIASQLEAFQALKAEA
jgi:putative heme utilization carrier protein HutX